MQKTVIIIILAVLAGALANWTLTRSNNNSANSGFQKCSDQYSYLSPELDCSTIDEDIDQVQNLHNNISAIIDKGKTAGDIDEVSVFYRDLNSRRWFGINENVNFYPASLAKLPFTMMMYKAAEIDKEILNEPIKIDASDLKLNDGQHYQPLELLESGKSYPVNELLRRLLVYSDNAPTDKLTKLSDPLGTSILDDLGVLFPPDAQTGEAQWNITAKIYANFFRILYNASYLRPEYSNIILDELSKSTFNNGLVAGIPEDTKVSHKYGEISQTNLQTNVAITVLNDCGIVFKKNNPYILCVMTRGTDFSKLEQAIANISKSAYQYSLN